MKHLPLIWAGLWRKPVRTVLTFLSLAAAFLLFGSLYGIGAGFDAAIERASPNRLRVQSALLGRAMPVGYHAEIERIPGVASIMISTDISAYYQQRLNLLYINAIGGDVHLDVFGDISNPEQLVAALRAKRTGALVGRHLAEQYGWQTGDHVSVVTGPDRNQDGTDYMEFDIVGIYEVPGDPESAHWFLLNYDYLEELRVRGRSTTNWLYVDTVDSSRNQQVASAIDRHFESSAMGTFTETERDYQRLALNQTIDMKLVVRSIVFASMFALLVLAANTMMQSVRQRLPEIAVLKAVGYSETAVTMFVICEALLLCVSAALVGIIASILLFPKIAAAVKVPGIWMPLQVPVVGILLAVLVALISSVVPAWTARRSSVAAVLAGKA